MWKIKEWFLHYKEAIRVSLLALFRWTLLAVCTGVLCGGIGTLFHLAVEWVTEQRTEHVWLLWLLPAAGIAITALYKATGCVGKGTNDVLRAVQDGSSVTPWLATIIANRVAVSGVPNSAEKNAAMPHTVAVRQS